MFSSDNWFGAGVSQFYNGVATQSLRFDNSDSAYLSLSPAPTGDSRKKFTFSCWVKRCAVGAEHVLFSAGANASSATGIVYFYFTSSDTLAWYRQFSGSGDTHYITSAKYRDTSAWYHVVLVEDANTTSHKIYVNGVEQAYATTTAGTNTNTAVGTTEIHTIGRRSWTASSYLNGYMAEVNFLDNITVGETDGYLNEFGELKNGVWIPKAYTGSYGSAGYRLEFKETGTGTGSTSTIGADTSGVSPANHWDSIGIVADDCNRTDSPENNHATLNPLQAVVNDNSTKPTLSEGNLVISTTTFDYQGYSSTMPIPTQGKYAFKVKMNTESNSQTHRFGIGTSISGDGISTGTSGGASSWNSAVVFLATVPRIDTNKDGSYSAGSTLSPATVAGDEIEFLVDMDNGTVDTKLNGSAYGTQITGMPTDKPLFPFATVYESSSGESKLTFTFDYTPSDSDYLTICSANLPEPTISPNQPTQADDYFNVVTYSGTGSTQTISDVGFNPDFIWFNRREASSNLPLYDSTRGGTNALRCNTNGAKAQFGDAVIDFTPTGVSTGFEIAGTNVSGINGSGETFVAWNWKANGGNTSTISADSVTTGVPSVASTVQANTDAGFSIVTFPANNTNGTKVGHGLNATPKMIIAKEIDNTSDWFIYHEGIGNGKYVHFNNLNSEGELSSSTVWGSADPDDNVFTIGNSATGFAGGGTNDALAYCFAEVEGYSKFGSFIGNGLTDGVFINLGFRPRFFMMFLVSSGSLHLWFMYDTKRGEGNQPINPESYFSEQSFDAESGFVFGDFVSNGIKIRNDNSARNPSGGEFIYMAFAENPFKYANAR